MSSEIKAPELLPVRMLNEFVYCPRLFHLEYVEGRWADNEHTEDGRRAHRRVDRFADVLPEAEPESEKDPEAESGGDERPTISRSVTLGSPTLGIVAKLDLVATCDDEAFPVDTKRGKPAPTPEGCWEPERVQLMAQGLLLREHGYRSDRGALYFEGARRRIEVLFTDELEATTREAIGKALDAARSDVIPPPLVESPKCWGCSLNGICLPDETLALEATPEVDAPTQIRRLYPSKTTALPLYVREQGSRVGRSRRKLTVRKEGELLSEVRIRELSQLVLLGHVSVSAQAIGSLSRAGVPIVHLSSGGWFHAITSGFGLRNAFDRAAQFRLAEDADRCLDLARAFVLAKAGNQRTLLRRNAEPSPGEALADMARWIKRIPAAESAEALLGLEGTIARSYFQSFAAMLRPPSGELAFEVSGRNRRPPRDPVNALLSFGYALLAKECTVALASVGLDPHWGFFHRPRHGRPALALDLMEEFRPLVVDSAVLTAVNTGMVTARDFTVTSQGCALGDDGRKSFIRAYEARLAQLATHPVFDYRCSWRQLIALQAQLLARHLRGDIPDYQGITVR